VLALTAVIRLAGASAFRRHPSYLCERFPAALRGSGFGLGYSTPLVLTSFYAYYQNWLGAILPRASPRARCSSRRRAGCWSARCSGRRSRKRRARHRDRHRPTTSARRAAASVIIRT